MNPILASSLCNVYSENLKAPARGVQRTVFFGETELRLRNAILLPRFSFRGLQFIVPRSSFSDTTQSIVEFIAGRDRNYRALDSAD